MFDRHHHHVAPLALLIILICTGQAQNGFSLSPPARPAVFLEKSYFSPGTPFGRNLIMEGQTSNHFFWPTGLSDAAQEARNLWYTEGGWQRTTLTSMMIVIRIYKGFSTPVRTPSFILRPLYVQMLKLTRSDATNKLWAFATGITHHSNGQAGCTFLGSVYDRDLNDCVIIDPTLSAQRIANTLDGSFSTNFIPIDIGYRRAKIGAEESMIHQWSIQFRFQIEINQLVNVPESIGSMTQELAEQYGKNLGGLYFEWEQRVGPPHFEGVARVAFWNQVRFGRYMEGSTMSGYAELSYTLKYYNKPGGRSISGEGMGVFARLHWGSDYYNIRFQDTDLFFQLGLMWDLYRLDDFQPSW